MFRIILLIFVFLYFTGNFFYGFILNYIPFKNAQNINIYDIHNIFDGNTEFDNFIFDNNLEKRKFENIGSLQEINVTKIGNETLTLTGLIIELPFKSTYRFGNRQEILIPIINKQVNSYSGLLIDLEEIDTIFDNIDIEYKNQIIKNGFSYLDYGLDYTTFDESEDIDNLEIKYKNKKSIFLNKLYLIKTIDENNNINFLLR